MSVLVAIPALNEAAHIAQVITGVAPFAQKQTCRVVVADGGSSDATVAIIRELMKQYTWLEVMDNPKKLQSAAVNLIVDKHGEAYEWLIRLDAHAHYPLDFLELLLYEAEGKGADTVVVSMIAQGQSPLQSLIALAQNSKFGNGGSAHRNGNDGQWVVHGHHALFRMKAFQDVGGYDPTFSHNEDAELDLRLIRSGSRIWLTAKTNLVYFPRSTLGGLMRQYANFGRGRAATFSKHNLRPAKRQAIVIALLPALLTTLLVVVNWIAIIPLVVWLLTCTFAGIVIGHTERNMRAFWAGPIAGLMQLAWSAGFWRGRLSYLFRKV